MKNAAKRFLSLSAALALCLSVTVLSSHAREEAEPSEESAESIVLTSSDGRFTLTAEKLAAGQELTVSAGDLGDWDQWCAAIHVSQDGADLYSLAGPKGQLPFLPLAQAAQRFSETALSAEDSSLSFTLTIPEEYLDWNIGLRVAGPTGASELSLTLEGMEEAQPALVAFRDVADNDWFHPYVVNIVRSGLMSGAGENDFNPGGELTVAEMLTLAAKLNANFYGQDIPRVKGEWYVPYYEYCLSEKIINQSRFSSQDMNRPATRFEMVDVLDRAACAARTSRPVNQLDDGFIPDLAENSQYGQTVYRWYRAGLISGGGDMSFQGDSGITRAETAVILCRLLMLVEPARLTASTPQR